MSPGGRKRRRDRGVRGRSGDQAEAARARRGAPRAAVLTGRGADPAGVAAWFGRLRPPRAPAGPSGV
ncbi:hypothetical protein SGPA1_31398 [Streptomyces misionensis JCM 4497]